MRRGVVQFVVMMGAVLALGGAASPPAAHILLSREAEPFRQAEQACAGALRGESWGVRSEVLDPAKPPAIAEDATVIAVGTEAAAWAQAHVSPRARVVYAMVADPEGAGLTAGRPVAGVLSDVPAEAQVAAVRGCLPQARVVGALVRAGSPRSARLHAAFAEAAGKAGLRVETVSVGDKPEVAQAVEELLRRRVDIVWTMPDAGLYDANVIKNLLQTTLRAGVPVYGFSTPMVRAGALVGAAVDPAAQGRRAAELALRPPDDRVPVAVNAEHAIGVNLIVAQRLNITVPAGFLETVTNKFE